MKIVLTLQLVQKAATQLVLFKTKEAKLGTSLFSGAVCHAHKCQLLERQYEALQILLDHSNSHHWPCCLSLLHIGGHQWHSICCQHPGQGKDGTPQPHCGHHMGGNRWYLLAAPLWQLLLTKVTSQLPCSPSQLSEILAGVVAVTLWLAWRQLSRDGATAAAGLGQQRTVQGTKHSPSLLVSPGTLS